MYNDTVIEEMVKTLDYIPPRVGHFKEIVSWSLHPSSTSDFRFSVIENSSMYEPVIVLRKITRELPMSQMVMSKLRIWEFFKKFVCYSITRRFAIIRMTVSVENMHKMPNIFLSLCYRNSMRQNVELNTKNEKVSPYYINSIPLWLLKITKFE